MWIKAFKTGTHKAMSGVTETFTRADLDAIVAGYDPTTRKAPLVLGHPKTEDRAYGWITDCKRVGDYLLVKLEQVEQAFAKAVNDGAFKYVSICLTPDKKGIRHLGVLGANPPAVQGLGELGFAYSSDSESGEAFEFGERESEIVWRMNAVGTLFQHIRDWILGEKDLETADRVLPQYELDWLKRQLPEEPTSAYAAANPQETPMTAEERAQLQSALARNAELEAANAALTAEASALRFSQASAADTAFVESLRQPDPTTKTGPRLTAAQVPVVLGLLSGLRAAGSFAFAADDGTTAEKPAAEEFKSFLQGLKPVLAYGEAATTETTVTGDAAAQIEAKIAEKMKADPNLSYSAAFSEVQLEFPTLAAAYAPADQS